MRPLSISLLAAAAVLAPGARLGRLAASSHIPCIATCAPTLTIRNLRDKGIVHSGFLVGTAAPIGTSPVTLVEVSLDGGATFATATGTTNMKFKFPVGDAAWKDNSPHQIVVRATDSDDNVTTRPRCRYGKDRTRT